MSLIKYTVLIKASLALIFCKQIFNKQSRVDYCSQNTRGISFTFQIKMRAVRIFNALLNDWKLEFEDGHLLGQIQEIREWDSMYRLLMVVLCRGRQGILSSENT